MNTVTEYYQTLNTVTEYLQTVDTVSEYYQTVNTVTEYYQTVNIVTEYYQNVNTTTTEHYQTVNIPPQKSTAAYTALCTRIYTALCLCIADVGLFLYWCIVSIIHAIISDTQSTPPPFPTEQKGGNDDTRSQDRLQQPSSCLLFAKFF